MLSSKLFSLLTFAAAAVAQGFPSGEFFIASDGFDDGSQLVLEVENGSSNPGTFIVLSDFMEGNQAQMWSYANGTGFLTNKGSDLVIEVPRTDGAVRYGTRLQQAVRRDETDDDLVQLWDYDAESQSLFTLADTTVCVTGNSSTASYVVVDYCGRTPSQRWRFIQVGDQAD